MIKKSTILALAVCAISLNSLSLFAATDEKYPAANFEPKVTYIDESVAQTSSPASVTDEKYPAANFQPKVTYIDDSVASDSSSSASSSSQQTAAEFDPKYPAAYFTPKIIYP